jgi:hypothetical protein
VHTLLRKISAVAALAAFTSGLAFAAVWGDLHRPADKAETHHSHGSSCPNPDSGDDPCGPTCACTCCPGHVLATAAVVVNPCLRSYPSSAGDPPVGSNLNPRDVLSRIFRPPRA